MRANKLETALSRDCLSGPTRYVFFVLLSSIVLFVFVNVGMTKLMGFLYSIIIDTGVCVCPSIHVHISMQVHTFH